jgi:hypothetical protein
MSSRVGCDKGHAGGLCREAAIRIAEQGTLGTCSLPGCGAVLRYIVKQHYANLDESHEYEVARVVRLRNRADADEEGYDPMIFLLRHRTSGKEVVWPFYWGRDKKNKWRVGQFPPLIGMAELQLALERMKSRANNETR